MIVSRIEDMLNLQVRLDYGLPQRVRPKYKHRLLAVHMEAQDSGTESLRHFRSQPRTSYERLLAARIWAL